MKATAILNNFYFRVTCGTVIVISMTIIIVYGFWVARVTKLLWLTSTILSFAQSVILLEHVYIRISQYMCQIINSFEKVLNVCKNTKKRIF